MSRRKAQVLQPLQMCLLAAIILLLLALAYLLASGPTDSQPAPTGTTIPLGSTPLQKPADLQGSSPNSHVFSPQNAAPLRPDQLGNVSL